jgi:hypothetical protein
MERLLELLGIPDIHSFRIQHVEQIRLAIEQNKLHCEKRWAESIAVGSRSYVAKIEKSLQYGRRRFHKALRAICGLVDFTLCGSGA